MRFFGPPIEDLETVISVSFGQEKGTFIDGVLDYGVEITEGITCGEDRF